MSRVVIFIILIVFFAACSNKDELPNGILSKPKMQAVLWDMVRTGEYLNNFVLYKDSTLDKAAETEKWYNKVYQVHKINKDLFDRSYAYYEQHPVLLKDILDSLSRKQVITRSAPASTTDTGTKKPVSPTIDTRIKAFDSIGRKRILKKKPGIQ